MECTPGYPNELDLTGLDREEITIEKRRRGVENFNPSHKKAKASAASLVTEDDLCTETLDDDEWGSPLVLHLAVELEPLELPAVCDPSLFSPPSSADDENGETVIHIHERLSGDAVALPGHSFCEDHYLPSALLALLLERATCTL